MAPTHDHGSRHQHSNSHSHSFSSYQLPSTTPAFNNDAHNVRKATSNGLFTHAETSRDTTPLTSPAHSPSFEQNIINFEQNRTRHDAYAHTSHSHPHSHSHSRHDAGSQMKSGRLRGESDLGRPSHILPAGSSVWSTYSGIITGVFIPVTLVLASIAASLAINGTAQDARLFPLRAHSQHALSHDANDDISESDAPLQSGRSHSHGSPALFALLLTSLALLLTGILGKTGFIHRSLKPPPFSESVGGLLTRSNITKTATRVLALAFPLYTSMLLGGARVGIVVLLFASTGLVLDSWQTVFASKYLGHAIVVLLSLIADLANWTTQESRFDIILGYLALACSIALLPAAFSTTDRSLIAGKGFKPVSSIIQTTEDVDLALFGGSLMAGTAIVGLFLSSTSLSLSTPATGAATTCIIAMTASVLLANPANLRFSQTVGLAVGYVICTTSTPLYTTEAWLGTACNAVLSALSIFSGFLGGRRSHSSHGHDHHHHHESHAAKHSFLTTSLLSYCEPGSLLHGILSEKDSRRIAYFTTLNFSFMFIQGVYGYLSGSLGLLSDTVHMFFDCLGLVVGLGAAVASKWPTSAERPYGWGKLNTLAGFGNGIFLMLVSVEFIWEAIEGIVEAKELRHVKELMVVSVLGFLVNMVGLFAFGHAHAGHDHGHSHGHAHDQHSHKHSHDHDHAHSHMNGHSHDHSHHCHAQGHPHNHSTHSHGHPHDHSHSNGHAHGLLSDRAHAHDHSGHGHSGHDHDNENMHGIFLHVAADAGGSLAVIVSTGLTLWRPWYLWDPIATIIIAVLIFAMAIPLVTSSGQKLLLVIPDKLEYNVKITLQELGELRGVVGYAVPRFWIDDKDDAGDSHGHHHHGHDHGPATTKLMGVIHVIAAHSADVEDVRERVTHFLCGRHMDVVVQMEKESGGPCWCRDASVSL